jgi:hypothetical protein
VSRVQRDRSLRPYFFFIYIVGIELQIRHARFFLDLCNYSFIYIVRIKSVNIDLIVFLVCKFLFPAVSTGFRTPY